MNYITVKLTEDQALYLQGLLNSEQIQLMQEGASRKHGMVAFAQRIRTKLAKAKTL